MRIVIVLSILLHMSFANSMFEEFGVEPNSMAGAFAASGYGFETIYSNAANFNDNEKYLGYESLAKGSMPDSTMDLLFNAISGGLGLHGLNLQVNYNKGHFYSSEQKFLDHYLYNYQQVILEEQGYSSNPTAAPLMKLLRLNISYFFVPKLYEYSGKMAFGFTKSTGTIDTFLQGYTTSDYVAYSDEADGIEFGFLYEIFKYRQWIVKTGINVNQLTVNGTEFKKKSLGIGINYLTSSGVYDLNIEKNDESTDNGLGSEPNSTLAIGLGYRFPYSVEYAQLINIGMCSTDYHNVDFSEIKYAFGTSLIIDGGKNGLDGGVGSKDPFNKIVLKMFLNKKSLTLPFAKVNETFWGIALGYAL